MDFCFADPPLSRLALLASEIRTNSDVMNKNVGSVWETKWFCVLNKFRRRDQPSVHHVMVVWTECNQVVQLVRSAVFAGNDMMNRCHMRKAAKNAFSSVSNTSGLLAFSVHSLRLSCHLPSVRFLSALFRAQHWTVALQARWDDWKMIIANLAFDGCSIKKRVLRSCLTSTEVVAALVRTKLAMLNVWANFKCAQAMLARKTIPSFSPSFSVVSGYKALPFSY